MIYTIDSILAQAGLLRIDMFGVDQDPLDENEVESLLKRWDTDCSGHFSTDEVREALAELDAMKARSNRAGFYATFTCGGVAFSSLVAIIATAVATLALRDMATPTASSPALVGTGIDMGRVIETSQSEGLLDLQDLASYGLGNDWAVDEGELRNLKSVSITTKDDGETKDWKLRVGELHRYDDYDAAGNTSRVEMWTYGGHWVRVFAVQTTDDPADAIVQVKWAGTSVWTVVDFASEDVTRRLREFRELNTFRLVEFLESQGVSTQVNEWLAEYETSKGEMLRDAYGRGNARYLKGGASSGSGTTSRAVHVVQRGTYASTAAWVGVVVVSERRRRGTYHNNDAYHTDKCKVRDEDATARDNRCRLIFEKWLTDNMMKSDFTGDPNTVCQACMDCRTQQCIADTHATCETFVSETHVDCAGDDAPLRYSFTIVVLSLLEFLDKITEL